MSEYIIDFKKGLLDSRAELEAAISDNESQLSKVNEAIALLENIE